MKKSLFIYSIAILTCSMAFGQQTYTLKGKIVSKDGNYDLIGARISFENKEIGTLANIDGEFELTSDHALPWVLKIDYIGYHEKKVEITSPDNFLLIEMSESSGSFGESIILPYRKPIEKYITGTISDKNTLKPLAGVEVKIKGLKKGTVSDAKGNFNLRTIQNFPCTLMVNKDAYNSEEIILTKEEKNLNIQLIYVLRESEKPKSTVPENPYKGKNCWDKTKKQECVSENSIPDNEEVFRYDCLLPYSWHIQPKVKVKGQVKEKGTGEVIAGATIYDTYSGKICQSDEAGNFEVNLPIADYTLVIKSLGFRTQYFKLTEDYFSEKEIEVDLEMDVVTFEELNEIPKRKFFGFLKKKKKRG